VPTITEQGVQGVVPTVAEQGFPGLDAAPWYSVLGPAGVAA